MAQRIQTLCEFCLDETDKETAATPVPIQVEDISALVDACPEHRAQYIAPVLAMMARFGRMETRETKSNAGPTSTTNRVRGAAARFQHVSDEERTYPCPVCPKKPFGTGVGLRGHALTNHSVNTTDVHGAVQWCRYCGWNRSAKPQALAVHISSMHGVHNIAQMVYQLSRSDPARVADLMSIWFGTDPLDVTVLDPESVGLTLHDGMPPRHDDSESATQADGYDEGE